MTKIGLATLRARLVAGIIVVITVVLAGTGGMIYWLVRERTTEQVDRSLANLARSITSTINLELGKRVRDGRPVDAGPVRLPPILLDVDDHFQCWFEDGEAILRSNDLDEELPRLAKEIEETIFADIELADGTRARAVAQRFQPGPNRPPFDRPGFRGGEPPRGGDNRPRSRPRGDGRGGQRGGQRGGRPPAFDEETAISGDAASQQDFQPRRPNRRPPMPPPRNIEIVVARDTVELEATLKHLRWMLGLSWLAASIGCAGILSLFVSLNLRPLRTLGRQIGEVDAGNLDQHFELDNAPRELTPVVDQLNEFVERVRRAFTREQAFASDAAHELRTPLAGLRSTLELALQRPREASSYQESIRDCLGITLQLQAMIETLLDLARVTTSTSRFTPENTRLSEQIEVCWRSLADTAKERGMPLVQHFDEKLSIHTEPRLLQRILNNVLENAVSHGDTDHAVEVEADIGDGLVTLKISNALAEAPGDVAERAFDAFWRADSARTSTRGHVGLGLSLCRRIAPLLEATVSADHKDGRFTVFVSGLKPSDQASGGR